MLISFFKGGVAGSPPFRLAEGLGGAQGFPCDPTVILYHTFWRMRNWCAVGGSNRAQLEHTQPISGYHHTP